MNNVEEGIVKAMRASAYERMQRGIAKGGTPLPAGGTGRVLGVHLADCQSSLTLIRTIVLAPSDFGLKGSLY